MKEGNIKLAKQSIKTLTEPDVIFSIFTTESY